MSAQEISVKEYLLCPTTGHQVKTNLFVAQATSECTEKVAIWWFCRHCNGWHILGLFSQARKNSYPSIVR
jgi:hypothetical protein